MDLPEGKTCDDCAHFDRCEWLVGAERDWPACDWEPLRFVEKAPTPPHEQG